MEVIWVMKVIKLFLGRVGHGVVGSRIKVFL